METIGHIVEQLRDTGIEQWQGTPAETASMCWPSVSTAAFESAPRFLSWTCSPCSISVETWSLPEVIRCWGCGSSRVSA